MELIIGLGNVKTTSGLLVPFFAITVTGPVVAAPGTVATIWESLHVTIVARVPPIFTKLEPAIWPAPKPVPVIVT